MKSQTVDCRLFDGNIGRRAIIGAMLGCIGTAATLASAESVQVVQLDREADAKQTLLALAEADLSVRGMHVDATAARVLYSAPIPLGRAWRVEPLWHSRDVLAELPMKFRLVSTEPASSSETQINASLAVPLLRDVWVASRRVAKGDIVNCADLQMERRDARLIRSQSLPLSCQLEAGAVALRTIGRGDWIRSTDIGSKPAVLAQAIVRVSVSAGGVSVESRAVALADGRLAEALPIRLDHPTRTLSATVTGSDAVRLAEGLQ